MKLKKEIITINLCMKKKKVELFHHLHAIQRTYKELSTLKTEDNIMSEYYIT